MSPTAKEIASELACLLDERRSVQECQHAEHHRFIDELIKEKEERQKMYAELRTHLMKGGLWGMVSFLALAVWYWVRNHL